VAKGFQGASFAKVHRPVGDPVSAAPEYPRYEKLPPFTGVSLTMSLEAILPGITNEVAAAGKIVFHAVGDTGGVHGTETETAIAEAMDAQIKAAKADALPRFLYHLGDVVYFNGLSTDYVEQFYEPYQYYDAPIFAIPGNHDGDTQTRKGDEADNEPSLYGFMKNFCSPTADHFFKYRSTMTQPYCYWTFQAPFAHIIGLYSNVDGMLDARGTLQQQNWLVDQLRNVPKDKWLVIAVHHPCFSLDSFHGGYQDVLTAVDAAFDSAGRMPDLVLSGHVHNYQRFSRRMGRVSVPYIINGNGGYANTERSLHKLQNGIETKKLPCTTARPDVKFAAFDTTNSGFLELSADADTLTVKYFSVSFDSPAVVSKAAVDTVTVQAGAAKKAA
jgi:3',5'-cyclic AMP phosphodiesterase CpdA